MARPASHLRSDTILLAAIELFRTKGLPYTSTRDLTEVMGISRSHIYHYFPNWQALCLAALEKFMSQDLQEAEKELAEMPAQQALQLLAEWFLPDGLDPDWLIYSDVWQISARDASYRELAEKTSVGWNALISHIVERGCDTGVFVCGNSAQAARQLSAVINGYADVLSLTPENDSRQQALADIDALAQLLLSPGPISFRAT